MGEYESVLTVRLATPILGCYCKGAPMSDDPEKCGPEDRTRINVSDEHELRYWAWQLGVDATTLKNAVKSAGTSVEAVRRHLKDGKH